MKKKQRVGFEPGIYYIVDWCPGRHSHGVFTFTYALFNEMMQHLLQSKVAKAESYLIGGYHIEWIELTYYIETLIYPEPCALLLSCWMVVRLDLKTSGCTVDTDTNNMKLT